MHSPRLVLITGPELRHEYFVRHINRHFAVDLVLLESKEYPPTPAASKEAQAAWHWFFERREQYEEEKFAFVRDLPRVNQPVYADLSADELNSDRLRHQLQDIDPDLILLFDCGLIGGDLMEAFPGRILNLHVGLTEAYRGSSCNFWPIHDERLDCLGATILQINPGIDTGAILDQSTVTVETDDDEQSLMAKTLVLGVERMLEVVRRWQRGARTAHRPERDGILCQRKDFKPEAVLRVRKLVESPRWETLVAEHADV